ncbi:MAG: DUF6159 family protein [Nanobdellota archaeon]
MLKERLTDLQYRVTQEGGAFDNGYWDKKREVIYVDIISGESLFSSKDKFDSGTGWPSFTRPLDEDKIKTKRECTAPKCIPRHPIWVMSSRRARDSLLHQLSSPSSQKSALKKVTQDTAPFSIRSREKYKKPERSERGMNAFSRSWTITKLSFNVLLKDKEMLLFPILSGFFSLVFLVSMLFPSVITTLLRGAMPELAILEYVMIFITYLGIAFIATFFNVCTVYTTKRRLEGGNATFMESIKFSFSKIHLIFAWSLLSATVGLILRILDHMAERMGGVGKIIMSIIIYLLGTAWSIITIFVVPVMVYNGLGPFDAIKKSITVLRKTWGESLIRYYGLGLAQFIFLLVGVLLLGLITIGLSPLGFVGIIIGIILIVLYIILVSLVFSIANSVFNTALFVYAETGRVPQGFSAEVVQGAFTKRPGRF